MAQASFSLAREAEGLAGDLPGLLIAASRAAAALDAGLHGRRRRGPGDAFWQYREHRLEDGARAVDWRKSAKGDRLFVRESEWAAAETALFRLDPNSGMDWRSSEKLPTKRMRGALLAAALGFSLAKGGERIGIWGGRERPITGAQALARFARGLLSPQAETLPAPPNKRSALILISDFYSPVDDLARALAPAGGHTGLLVAISDPQEEDFQFRGRIRFEAPSGRQPEMLIDRAEAAEDGYKARLRVERAALEALARKLGWALVRHRTDHPPQMALLAMRQALAPGLR